MANGLTTRVSIESMESDPDALAALRDAYSKMQQLTDNRGWSHWAGTHGYPDFMCWHHGRVGNGNDLLPYDLFLPWHRAFLLNFEHTARDQNPAATLPWWDWTSENSHKIGIPQSFSVAKIGGDDNPLARGPIPAIDPDPAGFTSRQPRNPRLLPTAQRIQDYIQNLDSFVDFSDQIQNVHDGVHGWVRGDMGVIAKSAFDPIFWSHHCMIDRVWYLWQLENGVNNIPDSYMDQVLAPFGMTVADVLDINQLGYEYAEASVTVDA